MLKEFSIDDYIRFKAKLAKLMPDSDAEELPNEDIYLLFNSIALNECRNPHVFLLLGYCTELGLPPIPPFSDAIVCYNRALEICPTCTEALRAKGHWYAFYDMCEESIRCFELAFEVDPGIGNLIEHVLAKKNAQSASEDDMEYLLKRLDEVQNLVKCDNHRGNVLSGGTLGWVSDVQKYQSPKVPESE